MPGPLTTVARVRDLGSLNDDAVTNFQARNLFGYATDQALIDRIKTEIAVASAWLQSRGGSDYASGDTVKDTLFAEAEAYLALQNMFETLKARKVMGIHFPLLTEGSERFEQLIDVEIPSHIQKFIDAYLVVEETGKPWQAPCLVRGAIVDRKAATFVPITNQLDELLDEVTGTPIPPLPIRVDGQSNSL